MANTIPHGETNHQHCFHTFRGPIWMVVPDGHVLEKCCKCETTRLIHIEHTQGRERWAAPLPDLARWQYNGVPRRQIY